jgi:hypothetical protein
VKHFGTVWNTFFAIFFLFISKFGTVWNSKFEFGTLTYFYRIVQTKYKAPRTKLIEPSLFKIYLYLTLIFLCCSLEKILDQNLKNQWHYATCYIAADVFIAGIIPANHHSKSKAACQPEY